MAGKTTYFLDTALGLINNPSHRHFRKTIFQIDENRFYLNFQDSMVQNRLYFFIRYLFLPPP